MSDEYIWHVSYSLNKHIEDSMSVVKKYMDLEKNSKNRQLNGLNYQQMTIIWINQHADFKGGAERYIFDTVNELNKLKVKNILLYEVAGDISSDFISIFDESFPLVDISVQAKSLQAEICYIHSISHHIQLEDIFLLPGKKIRFVHDHKILCPREHKYTAINKTTCKNSVSKKCIACCGMLTKSDDQLKIVSLSSFKQAQQKNVKFDRVIVASNYLKQALINEGFTAEKININPLFTSKAIDFSAQEKPSMKLLYCGQLVTGKGLDILIKAMCLINDNITLDIFGKGAQEKFLIQLVKKQQLQDRITFKGHQIMDAGIYQNAMAVCIPSRAPETFCLSGLEALAHRVPVIAADVGGISQWLVDAYNGLLFEPGNIQQLADAIERIAFDVEFSNKLRIHGEQSISDKFLAKHHINKLLSIFEEV
jgi:glycosyltransferase involved in cell wall biosynthesis